MTAKIKFEKTDYFKIDMQPLAGTSFVNLVKVLIDNKFKIDWQFLPRALYVVLTVLATTPFRFYERIKFDKQLDDIEPAPPLFIVGHWRSGTTFLHYLMGKDDGLAYVSTLQTLAPWFFLGSKKLFAGIVEKHLPEKRPMDDLEMAGYLPYEDEYAIANFSLYSFYHGWYFPRRIDTYFRKYVLFEGANNNLIGEWKQSYRYLLKKITYDNNGKRILLKSLVNTGRIKLLLDLFPDAQFIHMCRNPYEVYLSTWKLYKKILPIFSFQHVDSTELDQFILSSYRALYRRYLAEKKLIPKANLIEVRYENFVKDPMVTLENIYDTLDLEGFYGAKESFEKFVRKYKNYKPSSYVISEDIKEKLYREWKQTFDEFGYPL
jgi:hypothetical protein